MSEFKTIPLKEIKPDPNQPRKYYDELAMQELTESVKQKGILQPILLRPNGTGYIVVCGERRFKAATAAGLEDIPAVIRKLSDDEALELQIIENLQRKDVHPMEEAVAFKSLLDKGKDLKEIAARVGKSEFYARQRVKLCSLTKDWQQVFYANRISVTAALKVALFDNKIQKELFEEEVRSTGQVSLDEWTLRKYQGNLNDASFNLADTTLDKKMGACQGCKFNTASAALFETDALSPRCTNISCFTNKSNVNFIREFDKAVEDPEVIMVHDNYGNCSDKFVTKAQTAGQKVYSNSDYNSAHKPELTSWEEYLEDNADDESEDELKKSYANEVKEYEEDMEDYNKQITGGKFKKAFMLTGNDRGKYVYIKLTGNGTTTSSSKQTKEKEASGKLTVADIEEEIKRLNDREKRAKELDGEKVHAEVKDVLTKSKLYQANDRDCNLTKNEIVGAVLALLDAGSMEFRRWLSKLHKIDSYSPTAAQLEHLNGLTAFGLNEIILHFIPDRILSATQSRLINGKSAAIHNITNDYHSDKVSAIVKKQDDIAAKRSDRVAKRIEDLLEQKKEL